MRIEWKPEGEQQPEQPQEPVIHESDLTDKQKRELEKEKLKGMSWGKRFQYIWMYYKPAMAAILGVIILIYGAVVIYHNAKVDTVLYMTVVDAQDMDVSEITEDIREKLEWESKYQEVVIDLSLFMDGEENKLNYTSQMAFSTKVGASTVDVVIMPENLYDSFQQSEYFMNLPDILDEETCEKLGDALQGYGLILEESEIAETLMLTYEPVVVCVMANAPNPENAARWIAEYCIS